MNLAGATQQAGQPIQGENMSNLIVKDLMIPAGEYCRVKKGTTLYEAMQMLVRQGKKKISPIRIETCWLKTRKETS